MTTTLRFPAAFILTLGIATNAVAQAPDAERFRPDLLGFAGTAAPFLQKHCLRCHGTKESEGEFRVDRDLTADLSDRVMRQRWAEVVDVLNSHAMPPEGEPQPAPEATAKFVDWITAQSLRADEIAKSSSIVLRRLNRTEYRNTIRDLLGIEFDTSGFPQDPPAGGFDNNGSALTMSPLHLELYYAAAEQILDRVIVSGERPSSIRWRFEPESGDSDSNRVTYDGQRVIVNGGNNPARDGYRVVHHENWDKHINARDFRLPHVGDYVIRVRAAGQVPGREQVVESARLALQHRLDQQLTERPDGARWHQQQFDRDLEHFRTSRIYDYGPPRARLTMTLGGQPRVLAEFDVPRTLDPQTFEFTTRCTTESAGVTVDYAYSIPRELENFWMQTGETFARPELFVDWIEIEGPVYSAWPPEPHSRLLFEQPRSDADEPRAARAVLSRFLRLAWRRPVTDAEVDSFVAQFATARKERTSFTEAIRVPLTAILVSPQFLFLAEPVDPATDGNLSQHELAARMSYFLWSSMPDEELLRLADAGRLSEPRTLVSQVDRMLADVRSREFVRNFAGQWLGLRDVGANPPAEDLYPQYDRHLETSIIAESESFFAEILDNNLDALNLVKSDFVVINERLARFYGIDGVRGDEFRRVPVPRDVMRGGVLTQASILTTTSNGTRTSPVKRGTWIMKNILGADPGLPVANAGEIAPKVPGIDKATVRQRLEIHRTLPQCARCHNKIDPLGFALENFNACGEYREQEGHGYKGRIERDDPKIDAASQLPDGTRINGVRDLQDAIARKPDEFLTCLAGKLLTYALGREPGLSDRPTIEAAVAHMQTNGRTLRSLIEFVVTSESFRSR